MSTKREITKKHAREYASASKKERGRMLDSLVATTGWSRANARRQLTAAAARKGPQRAAKRQPRPRTYVYDTLRLLIRVWMLAGQPAGKYLAATNADIVRRHAFHYRYDTAMELRLLNELYDLVPIRFNMFTATTKAVGWRADRNGKAVRVHDKPRTTRHQSYQAARTAA